MFLRYLETRFFFFFFAIWAKILGLENLERRLKRQRSGAAVRSKIKIT